MAPVVIFFAYLGGLWFAALILLCSVIIYWEWVVMTLRAVDIRRDALGIVVVISLIFLSFSANQSAALWAVLGLFFISVLLLFGGAKSGHAIVGTVVAGLFSVALLTIREVEVYGLYYLVFLAFTVWSADVFAYIAGRSIGGPKLAPGISPNKTWAGFVGGLAGGVAMGALIAFLFKAEGIGMFALLALVLGFSAQFGDLIESAVKRRFNVKDASNLIPGHGGLLDRVDGLIFAAFVFVLLHQFGFIPPGGAIGG